MKTPLILLALMVATNPAGHDSSGITLAASVRPAPLLTVSGRVLGVGGKPASETIVSLLPIDRETGVSLPVQRTTQTDADGSFAIRGILPGRYLLVAKLQQGSQEFWSEKRIEVADSDVADVLLQLSAGFNLSGSLATAGGPSLAFQGVRVRMSPEDGSSQDVMAEVNKDGAFSFSKLRRTTYRLQLIALPDGWYLRSGTLGQQNVLKDGINLAEADAGQTLNLTLSSGVGKVRGIVLEPVYNDLVPNAIVKLFPDPPNPHRSDLYRAALTDKDGRFTIDNVVPGKYRVLAIMSRKGAEGAVDNYDDSLTAAAAGIRITLAEKQSKRVEVELFEAHR